MSSSTPYTPHPEGFGEVLMYLATEGYKGLRLDGFEAWWDFAIARNLPPTDVMPIDVARWVAAMAWDARGARRVG